MRRLAPVAFLLVVVGLVSALVSGGAAGGDVRPPTGSAAPATVILDLTETPQEGPPSADEAASQEATSTASAGAGEAGPDTDTTAGSSETTATTQASEDAPGGPEEPAADEGQAGEADTYTVKQGDTPYSIALSQGVSAEELMGLNGIDDPTSLQIGDVLRLPQP